MNSNRRINQPPLEDIESDDLLSTHGFVSSTFTSDLNEMEKTNFRDYYNTRTSGAAHAATAPDNMTVKKDTRKIIKTERKTIISIDTRDRDENAFPEPNHVKMAFGKSFYNVKEIKLVSTEFPNTDQVIRDVPVEIRNNRISWENAEDADLGVYGSISISTTVPDTVDISISDFYFNRHIIPDDYFVTIYECSFAPLDGKRIAVVVSDTLIRIPFKGGVVGAQTAKIDIGHPNYTVDLTPGNYSIKTLSEEFERRMNLVKRRNGNSNLFHFFKVQVDLSTDIMTFSSYVMTQLTSDPIIATLGSSDIRVFLFSHGYKVGDTFLITGTKTTGGINQSVLDGLFVVKEVINMNLFVYEVNDRANENKSGGGFTVKLGRPDDFRILFLTGKSLVVGNIGFPGEDSSQSIEASDPFLTKTLQISNAVIIGDYIRFTTTIPHLLKSAVSVPISAISTNGEITTTVPHRISDLTSVEIADTDSVPKIQGIFAVTVTGNFTFTLKNATIGQVGTTGVVKHSGDRINLTNFKTSPKISNIGGFTVENATNSEFDIRVGISYIDPSSISKTTIGTGQVLVTHPNHGFKQITAIQPGSVPGRARITVSTRHNLYGRKYLAVVINSFTSSTADVSFPGPHSLVTSDRISITNTGIPALNADFFVQRVDNSTVRINTFLGEFGEMIGDVHVGDSVVFNGTDSTPNLVVASDGSVRFKVINVNSEYQFDIETGFDITAPGTQGIVGRENSVSFGRITSSEPGKSDLGGIPLILLNKMYHRVSEIRDDDHYLIRIPQNFASRTVQSGGSGAVVSSKRQGFKVSQANTFNGNGDGILFRSISLEGENYVLLISPNLSTVHAVGGDLLGDIFAKILLSEPPGVMMFNSFITAAKEFNPPLSFLDGIEFEVKRADGYYYNFNRTNFSISIAITESVDRIRDSYISSQTGVSDLY
jgi:hypothetical protein